MRALVQVSTACFCVLQLLIPADAQTPAEAPPVLRVTTRLVQVNVVVHRKGEPVADLTKDDFVIYDQGKEQKIASFAVESSQPSPTAAKPKPLPPDIFTNRLEYRPAVPRAVTVILLDGLNTSFEAQASAKQQVIKFLGQLEPGDRIALYTLGRDLRILHDFTSDSNSLLRLLKKHGNHIASELAESTVTEADTGDTELDAWLDQSAQRIADFQTINRVHTTLAALEGIAHHVSSLPGRKNLVWISGGFPFSIGMDEMVIDSTNERRTFSDELERTARAVNSAGLSIYPVDARGLISNPDFNASVPGRASRTPPPPGPSKAMRAIQQTHDSMETIAQRTGGKAYYNSNDIKSAIRGAIDDSKVTYVLGYYPSHNTWDGKFHDLKVKLNRNGVNVRHRLGYFAFPEQPQAAQTRQVALREAAWSVLDATTIPLTVRLGPNLPQPGKLRVVMQVDLRSLNLEQKADRWIGTLDILFVQQAGPDQGTKVINDTLNLNLTRASRDQLMKSGMVFAKDLEFPEAAYALRVAVRDATSGSVGSVNMRTDKLPPFVARPTAATPAK